MFNDWRFLMIFSEPWFWQGLIVNSSFTLAFGPLPPCLYPFRDT